MIVYAPTSAAITILTGYFVVEKSIL